MTNNIQDELIALRSGQKESRRSGDYWSEDDLKTLCNLYWAGSGISELAIQMGRTEVAIYQQLSRNGMFEPQCVPRPRRHKDPTCHCPTCAVKNCQHCGEEFHHA